MSLQQSFVIMLIHSSFNSTNNAMALECCATHTIAKPLPNFIVYWNCFGSQYCSSQIQHQLRPSEQNMFTSVSSKKITPMLHKFTNCKLSTSWLNCTQMTLATSKLKNIFLLHSKMQTRDTCHENTQKYPSLAYQNARLSSKIIQCATLNVKM